MTHIHTLNQRGYIALLAILVVGAASLAIAIGLLLTGTDNQRSTLVVQSSARARNLAAGCGEEALQTIHDNTAYTGTATLTLSTGTCSFTVTSTGSTTRTINTVSTVNTVTRRNIIYVTISASNISIASWQEVSDAG